MRSAVSSPTHSSSELLEPRYRRLDAFIRALASLAPLRRVLQHERRMTRQREPRPDDRREVHRYVEEDDEVAAGKGVAGIGLER